MSGRRIGSWLAGLGALLLTGGCFRDSGVASTRCVSGESTCSCRSGASPCDAGLICDSGGICRSVRCEDGREGCACVDGNLCLGQLECIDDSCLPPGGDDSGTPTTTGTTTTSTSNGVTTAQPVTTDNPVTSVGEVGPGTTTMPPDTDDTSMMTSGPGTGGDPNCACGWSDVMNWYECGVGLPFEAPDGMPPRACPNQPIGADQPCGTIEFEGCCDGSSLVFCGTPDVLYVDECGAIDEMQCGSSLPPV